MAYLQIKVSFIQNTGFLQVFNKNNGSVKVAETHLNHTHSTIFLLIIKLMKKHHIFFYISTEDASNFYQYQVSGASKEKFYTFLPLDAFSRPEIGKIGSKGVTIYRYIAVSFCRFDIPVCLMRIPVYRYIIAVPCFILVQLVLRT